MRGRTRKPYNWNPNNLPGRKRRPFESFYIPEPNTGCWLWIGSLRDNGYGLYSPRVNGKRRTASAHRWSWELRHGPIPAGMQANHKCDVPSCVNPDHLFLGTQSDNMKDACRKRRVNAPGITKGWPLRNAAKTHCKHGHPFTPENTWHRRRKSTRRMVRQCKTCCRMSHQRRVA